MPRPSATRTAFLRAVRESPERDEPRLAFARWLRERRNPADRARGEFIELQVAWARPGLRPSKRMALRLRDRQLRQQFEAEWLKEVPELLRSVTFKRGFIEELAAGPDAFIDGANELFAREAVQEVCFWNATPRAATRLAECPALAQVRRLRFCDFEGGRGNHLGALGVFALAASPFLSGVEALYLDGAQAGEAAMEALVCSPHLRRLTALAANESGLSSRALAAMGVSRLCRQLKRLHVSHNALGAEGVRRLLQIEWPRLVDLGVSNSGIDASHLCQILDAETLPRLRSLWGNGSKVGPAGARRLACARGLGRLRELGLADCALGDGGLAALVTWGAVGRLRWLNLGQNELTARAARALASAGKLGALRGINLDDNRLGPEGAVALAAAPFFRKLSELSLDGNQMKAAGLGAMLASLKGGLLRTLMLHGNALDDEGARLLLSWRGLRYLDLLGIDEGNHFSAKFAQRLVSAFRAELAEA